MKQWLRFIGVGGMAALSNWGIRLIMNHWLSFSLSVCLAYLCGMGIAFWLNVRYVFPTTNRAKWRLARDFCLTNLCSLGMVWATSLLLLRYLPLIGITTYTKAVAHGLALATPVAGVFFIYKILIFRKINE